MFRNKKLQEGKGFTFFSPQVTAILSILLALLFTSSLVSFAFAADKEPPEIISFQPDDGSFVDFCSATINIFFAFSLDTKLVLDSVFLRKTIEGVSEVPEIEATLCEYLFWFGDPAEAAKYDGYGCQAPYGMVSPGLFDVNFGGGNSSLAITTNSKISSPVTGNLLEPGGKYTLRITDYLGGGEYDYTYTYYCPGYGNVDLDGPPGSTDVGDPVYLDRALVGRPGYNLISHFASFGLSECVANEIADMDDSDTVDVGDSVYLDRYITGRAGYQLPQYSIQPAPKLLDIGDPIIVSIGEVKDGDCGLVNPIVIKVGQGETEKEVPINVCNVSGREIDGVEIDISYDASVAEIKLIDPGDEANKAARPGENLPASWIIVDNSENVGSGTYKVIIRDMGESSITSDMTLCYLTFKANSSDITDVTALITNAILKDVEPGGSVTHPVDPKPNDILLPVKLSALSAFWNPDGIRIFWQAESQNDNLGWNIYRSESKDGKFVKINGTLIKGAGTTSVPTKYNFIDKDAEKGKTYFYYLEDISYNGEKHQTNPIKSTPLRLSTSWGAIKRSVLK
jgi:hypothetical protein